MTHEKVLINEIMTTEVISVLPNTPLLEVARILGEHKFDGVPVVNVDKKLVGIINEYDLLSKGSAVHLPTLNSVLKNLSLIDSQHDKVREQYQQIMNLTAADVMNRDPLILKDDQTFDDAVKLFSEHHRVNPIPVLSSEGKIKGIVSRYDILKVYRILSSR